MRPWAWIVWAVLLLVLLSPVLRFADGGGQPSELRGHNHREPFVKTPWIASPDVALVVLSLLGAAPPRGLVAKLPLIADPLFVPPEA